MKILFLYICGLATGWLGVNTIMFALAHWSHDGVLMPLTAGFLLTLLSFRLLLGLVRLYLPPKGRKNGYLD